MEEKEVPFGAKPEEVADNVPIMASEGEYVIPANVVRFLGLDKIEKMVNKAKEALHEMGELVGHDEEVEEDDFPFSDDELVGVDEPDEELQAFADGGSVQGIDWPEGAGIKEFKGPDGMVMYIPYNNGQPLQPVPAGYEEVTSSGEAPGEVADPMDSVATPKTGNTKPNFDNKEAGDSSFVEDNRSVFSKDPKTWGVNDFVEFGNKNKNFGDTAIKGMIGMLPGGKMAMKARESWLNNEVAEMFDTMVKTGVDPQGNKINPADMTNLLDAKANLMNKMDSQTGIGFGPADTLMSAVQKFTDFVGGKKTFTPTQPSKSSSESSPKSSLNKSGTKMVNSYSKVGTVSDSDEHSGGSYGVGSDMGKSGPTTGSMASGGLYAAGGLITRKKK